MSVAAVATEAAQIDCVPVDKVFEIIGGGTPSKRVAAYYGGDIPWATIRDMGSPELAGTEHTITAAGLANSSSKLIRAGEVIMACRVGLGKACILKQDTAINQDIRALIPRASGSVDRRFCLYWLQSIAKTIIDAGSGATVQGVKLPFIKSLPFPTVPLAEQKRIVAVLDQAFAALDRARANAEVNLADAAELFETSKQSILEAASHGDSLVSLGNVSSIESSLVDPRDTEYVDLPHIGAGNMCTGSGELIGVMTAREEKLKSGKYLFDDRDVLYSKIRPYLRKVARPSFSGLCSADVYPLRPSEELDKDFLFHTLLGTKFTKYAESGSARAGMPKVNREHLFRYEFRLPTLLNQRNATTKIDDALCKSNELREMLACKLADLAALRQSLLQKAFAGELT